MLSEEPSLKDRVIAFFKGSPKRYSFAPEMDGAAKRWIQEYKKIFDQVSAMNAGNNVAENLNTVTRNEQIKRIGKLVDELGGNAATQVPKSVIKRIGKVVPEGNGEESAEGRGQSAENKIVRRGKLADSDKKTATGTENVQDSGERFAINEDFEESLNRWDKKTIGFSFVVGETSNALQEAGIPKRQIRWDASKIATLLNKHKGMSIDVIKQIPQLLELPVIVIDSKKGPNAKIVMGDLYDSNNKVVTAVLLLTPTSKKGNVLELIKISSAEGRGHIKSLFTYDDGTSVPVRYVDKKRIQSWLNVNRLQLPLHNLDSDSINIVSQNAENSNTSDKNSSKDFDSGERFALADGSRATSTEVAAAKRNIREMGVDPAGIISIADKYFDRYSGQLTRTGVRYEFLSAAESLFDKAVGAMDRAYTKIEALADELISNEKDTSGRAEEINSIKRHIREITFEVRERDKGEFDSVGGYAQFRKDNFGKLKLGNDGASVDTVYAELQNLYGTSMFPDLNTVGEMLIHIASVCTKLSSRAVGTLFEDYNAHRGISYFEPPASLYFSQR